MRTSPSLWPVLWWQRRERRADLAVAGVLMVFVIIHLVRAGRVGMNYDGPNYLRDATVFADGGLARSRYSPGWGALLTPLVWITGGTFRALHTAGVLLTVLISVTALVLVYVFLRTYLRSWTAAGLVAVLALGESATNALFGVEVEPLSLLLVTAVLLAQQRQRAWLAVLLTGVAAVSRVALVPFMVVLWLPWLVRRGRVAAVMALVLVAAGVFGYLATQPEQEDGYIQAVYLPAGPEASLPHAGTVVSVASQNLTRYPLRALPAMLWPVELLASPLGVLAGAGTTAVIAVGAWRLVREPPAPPESGGHEFPRQDLPRWAVLAGAVELGLLLAWPATDSAAIRFVIPLSAVVLLAAAAGGQALSARGRRHTRLGRIPLGRYATAAMLLVGLVTSVAVTARHRTTEPRMADFIAAVQASRADLPEGAVLSRNPAIVEIITDREVYSYRGLEGIAAITQRGRLVGACAAVVTGYDDPGEAEVRGWGETGAGVKLSSVGDAAVFAFGAERCSEAPSG